MKPLKASARENRRYLLVKGKQLGNVVDKAILAFVGILGYAKASPCVVSSGKDWLILSVRREALSDVRAALLLCADDCRVERVSGTLKGLKGKSLNNIRSAQFNG